MSLSGTQNEARSLSEPDWHKGVLATSPLLSPDGIATVVCIPTFRRSVELAATLESLLAQTFDEPFAVVIAENDARGRAGAAVATAYLAGRLHGLCVLAELPGNCQAINKAFAVSRSAFPSARHFLMIDDDEVASPEWLATMVRTARATGADIVGGPVFPSIPPGAPPELALHPAFHPAYTESGPVPMIYGSGNCLIDRHVFETLESPDFDLRYNFLGGGDTDFFDRSRRAGLSFHWAAEARITETVPIERTRPGWLWRRGLRIGAINFDIERKHVSGLLDHARLAAKNAVVLALAGGRGLKLLCKGQTMAAFHPLAVAVGRIGACIGYETQEYRAGH